MMHPVPPTSLVSQLERHRARILHIGRFLAEPEELFQETAMACICKIGVNWSIEHPDYIFRIAIDQLSRICRKAKARKPTVSFETLPIQIPDQRELRGIDNPESQFEELRRAVESLKDNYRTVVTKRFRDGMSFSEIASELGITIANARQRYQRALDRLRRSLMSSQN